MKSYLDEVAKPATPAEGQTWQDQVLGGESPDDQIAVRSPSGSGGTVARKDLPDMLEKGFRLEHPEETHDRALEKEYGDSPVQTALEAGLSTATFGVTDLVGGEGMRERRKRNKAAALVGSVAGAFVPGAGALATGLGKAAGGLVAGRVGSGLGGRVLAAGTRGAAEGALFGGGVGVSEIGLSKDPVSWEGAAATLGSNVLSGAVFGAGIGVGGKLLEEGASAAARAASRKLAEIKSPGATAATRGEFPEIAGMDKKATREAIVAQREVGRAGRATEIEAATAARKTELAAIEKAKDAAADSLYQEAKALKDSLRFVPTADRQLAKQLGNANRSLVRSLDNPKAFVRERATRGFVDGLERQEAALTKALAGADDVIAKADLERQAMLDALPNSNYLKGSYLPPELSKSYADFAGIKLPKGQSAISVMGDELDAFRSAIQRGDVNPPQLERVLNAQSMLEANQGLQAKIKELRAPAASDALAEVEKRLETARSGLGKNARLEALEAHLADLSEATLGKRIAQGAGALAGGSAGFSVGGALGAAAGGMVGRELGERVYERLVRRIQTGNAARAKSIGTSVAALFAKSGEKAAKAVARTAPLASKVLPAIRYASPKYVDGVLGKANEAPSKDPNVTAFRARARELNALTERRPDGGYSVRMPAREALNQRLQGLWAIDPDFANGVEMTHNARVEFLAGKLPRNPAPPHLQVGPDTWQPGREEMAKFARYMEAVEQPEKVIERMATATMTPEDAEVLKTVYPQTYEQVRAQLFEHMAEVRTSLPYSKRLALSIYLDVDVDPALTPEIASVYQRPPQAEQAQQQSAPPPRPLPTGMVAPTQAQRMSSK